MFTSRRAMLAAAGAGLVSPHTRANADVTITNQNETAEGVVAEIIWRSEQGHAALMRGDTKSYSRFISLSHDFLLMSPFGGKPTRGADYTQDRIEAMGRFFRNGTFEQEVLQTYASADMVILALIERQNVEVGGLPAQDWPLRVTLVYRREGQEWRLIHRHADPLVNGVNLQQAAALARGG